LILYHSPKKMKKMKILKTTTAAVLFFVGTVAMAQQGPGKHQMRSATERAKTETEKIAKSLDLNKDQTTQILEINYKYAVKDSIWFAEMRKEQNKDEKVDRETIMKTMKEERAAKTTEVKAVLTDDQKAKYDALLKEREQRGPRPEGQGAPEGAPEGGPQGGPEGGE
jgi:periplasmic protein CpxP/Spy